MICDACGHEIAENDRRIDAGGSSWHLFCRAAFDAGKAHVITELRLRLIRMSSMGPRTLQKAILVLLRDVEQF